jgi:hypothetical protein
MERFPEIAARALEEDPPADHLDALDVVRWVLRSSSLPNQRNVGSNFGEPPVHVYDAERFFIQVLHWIDGTTAVHQHSFCGAFHVLGGSSVHALYRFEEEEQYGNSLRLGKISVRRAELLNRGATREILPQSAMIHSLFHLERPSVTVVVRTPGLTGFGPQFQYLRPRIAIDPFYVPDETQRKIQSLGLFARVKVEDYEAELRAALRSTDEFGLVQIGLASVQQVAPGLAVPVIVEEARRKHSELADALLEALTGIAREQAIVGLRRKLRSPDDRFFLALLMSFRRANEFFPLIAVRYPNQQPEDVVIDWLRRLAEVPDPDAPDRRVFGVAPDEGVFKAMRHMVGGRSVDEVLELLREERGEYVADDRDAIGEMYGVLHESIFASVFA